MFQTTLPTTALRAALHCVAKSDVRDYLNGVRIEFLAPDACECILMATDGHALFACRALCEPTEQSPFHLILPTDAVAAAIKTKASTITLSAMPDGRYLLNATVTYATSHDFDWRRVIPRKVSGAPAAFNPDVWHKAHSAMREICGAGKSRVPPLLYRVFYNAEQGPTVFLPAGNEDAIALAMPIRDGVGTEYPSAYVDDKFRAQPISEPCAA